MLKTILNPTEYRTYLVGLDETEPEEITAKDLLSAFSLWWKLNRGSPINLEIEISGYSDLILVWVGDELYKIRDITAVAV